MTVRIVDIPDAEMERNAQAEEILRAALESADEGLVDELLLVWLGHDGAVYMKWTDTSSVAERAGMLELLKLQWMNGYRDG